MHVCRLLYWVRSSQTSTTLKCAYVKFNAGEVSISDILAIIVSRQPCTGKADTSLSPGQFQLGDVRVVPLYKLDKTRGQLCQVGVPADQRDPYNRLLQRP